jgi:hypothetical protein
VVELNHDQNAAACFVTPVIGFAHGQAVERREILTILNKNSRGSLIYYINLICMGM